MGLQSRMAMSGVIRIYNTNTGELLREAHNIITSGGCAFMAGYLSGGTMTAMSTVAVGSGSTTPTTADTALAAEIGGVDGDRHAATVTAPTSTSVKFSSTYGAGHATGNWYEAGIFNSTVAAGLMLCRVTYGLLTKAATDAFTIDYTTSFADDGI